MIDILIGVVTYNPDPVRLQEMLDSVRNQAKKIFIVDNHSNNIGLWKEMVLQHYVNVKIVINKKNYGIAHALNQIFLWGEENSYKWVLTLDQDSICPTNLISDMVKYIDQEKIAVIGPTIKDRNKVEQIIPKEEIVEVDNCITSGSLNCIEAWNKIGGFDEWMFIDGVDFDFCHRIRNAGYRIVINKNIILNHEIGHITMRRFLWMPVVVRNHSAFRKYYIVRNIIYLDKKENNGRIALKTFFRVLKQFVLVILYENEKNIKIKKMVKGDGIKVKF